MTNEWMILVTGTVQRRRTFGDSTVDPGSEFKISKIEMLADSREKRLDRLCIKLNLEELDDKWVETFDKITTDYKVLDRNYN